MYSLVNSLLGIPSSSANSTVSYVCGALALLFAILLADLVIKLIRAFLPLHRR